MEIDSRAFENVPFNTTEQSPCSPPIPGADWRGIVIQTPRRIVFTRKNAVASLQVPLAICGFYLVPVPGEPVSTPMQLVAHDRRTGQTYTGEVSARDPSPEVPPPEAPPLTPEELEGLAAGSYFTLNLTEHLQLPAMPATYEVHVEFRDYRSSIVVVQVVEE